jgi:Fur family ferric uptake transcriptional regulator
VPKAASIRTVVKRKTRQRDAIREVFTSARRPLSSQEVAAAAQRTLPSLGIATVYRAIKHLLEEGWLVPVSIAGGTRYELADTGPHHHFHCLDCDKTFDISGCAGNVQKLAPSGFRLASHELTLSGTCRWCAEQR